MSLIWASGGIGLPLSINCLNNFPSRLRWMDSGAESPYKRKLSSHFGSPLEDGELDQNLDASLDNEKGSQYEELEEHFSDSNDSTEHLPIRAFLPVAEFTETFAPDSLPTTG